MIRRLLRDERGVALVMATAFMLLSLPLAIAALRLASTLALDSRTKTGILQSQYSTLGANQFGLYKLVYESGFVDSIPTGGSTTTTVTLNGTVVTVNISKLADSPLVVPPKAVNSRRLRVTKSVSPTTGTAGATTTLTYTLTIDNRDDQNESLNKIHDEIPAGFSYVSGTGAFSPPGGGSTSTDPSISGQQLTWDLNASGLNTTLSPADVATLTFDATGSVAAGTYCNEAWAEPGGKLTSTLKTAIVTVGSPGSTLCSGAAIVLTKTVDPTVSVWGAVATTHTYTITLQNTGTADLNISQIRDFLPGCTVTCDPTTDAFIYDVGSSTGVTTNDPSTNIIQQTQPGGDKTKRQRLDWNFSPKYVLSSGATSTLVYTAQKKPNTKPGDHWNEVLVTIDEFGSDPVYSWPTAKVRVLSIMLTCSTDGKTSVSSEVWVGTDTHVVNDLDIVRSVCP